MAWNRQKSTVAPPPKEPSMMLWLLAGAGALFAGILLFILHANQLLGVMQKGDPWVIAAIPVALWFSLFCLQGWFYNRALEHHQFELRESEFAQQQWEAWATRYHAVLHSMVILPERLTSISFLNAGKETKQHCNQTLRLDFHEDQTLVMLLANVADALKLLPADLPLNVILLTDAPDDNSLLMERLTQAWHIYAFPGVTQPTFTVLKECSYHSLDTRFQHPEICAELILVQQTHGAEQWSGALASLLLVSDDVAAKYSLVHDARLLRPMSLEEQQLADDLTLFFSTQTIASKAQHIVGDSLMWRDSFFELLDASAAQGSSWKVDQTHWLEQYAGRSGPFSPWIIAAIASDVVNIQKGDCLMLASTKEQKFINTATTGTGNQDGHNG